MKQTLEIIHQIFKGNQDYIQKQDTDFFSSFKDTQTPKIVLLTCSDSRVQTSVFGIEAINNIFVVRNIGNQIMSVFGSIDYAIYNLKVPLLIIMGHSHCGAIRTVFTNYHDQPFDIIRELDHLAIPIKHIKQTYHDFEKEWLRVTEVNLDYQIKLAVKKYHDLVEKGELLILGIVNDFANVYKRGEGRLIVINVNGEINPKVNMKHAAFASFEPEIKNVAFARSTLNKDEIFYGNIGSEE
jgi:carbonic anhydrase